MSERECLVQFDVHHYISCNGLPAEYIGEVVVVFSKNLRVHDLYLSPRDLCKLAQGINVTLLSLYADKVHNHSLVLCIFAYLLIECFYLLQLLLVLSLRKRTKADVCQTISANNNI